MFENIGKINSYVNMQNMQKAVFKKIKDNDFLSTNQTQISSVAQPQNSTPDKKLEAITYKLKSGKKLSAIELNYLQEKSPELYSKAMRVEEERKDFEKKLKLCKSKAEARALHLTNVSFVADTGKAAEKVGNTDEAEYNSMLGAAINKEWNEFTKTKIYRNLPEKIESKKSNEQGKKGFSIQV